VAKFVALLDFNDDKELLARTRPAHREYLQELVDAGKIWLSGPWVDDTGAMLVFDTETMEEAQRLIDDDPYQTEGVLSNARIKEWRLVFQAPGGS
jgi:uncharacterized protein YciI